MTINILNCLAFTRTAPFNRKNLNPIKTSEIIENKNKALKLKERGNDAFKRKKYEVAEKFYSEALQLNPDSRPIWTNRAICRNTMKKHEDALTDCMSALSIDSKCKKAGFQKFAPELKVLYITYIAITYRL